MMPKQVIETLLFQTHIDIVKDTLQAILNNDSSQFPDTAGDEKDRLLNLIHAANDEQVAALGQKLLYEVRKITHGFVTQRWSEGGTFLGQKFTAGDQVEYEDQNGNPTDKQEPSYQPFDMVQP